MLKTLRAFAQRSLILGTALAVVGIASVADAQDSDLQKRVEALEAQLANPLAGWGKGPYIKSDDGLFSINFGTRIQLRYTYQGRDAGHGNTNTADSSFVELERARMKFQGNFLSKNLGYKIEVDTQTDGGGANATDIYLTYKHKTSDSHSLTFGGGQFKPFFGRQEKTSSSKQLLVDRSLANEYFSIDRNIGVWMDGLAQLNEDGAFNAIGYHIAVTNGFDSVNRNPSQTNSEQDHIPAIIAHLDFHILGNLGKDALSSGDLKERDSLGWTTGLSFASDQNNNTNSNTRIKFKIYQFAWDNVFKYGGFSLNTEYFGRFLDIPGDGMSSVFTHGGYVEAGYIVCENTQLVARASVVWDRDGSYGSNSSATELAVGVNRFFKGHNLKLSADVGWLDIPPGMTRNTEGFPGASSAATNIGSGSANITTMQGVLLRVQAQLNF